MTRAESERSATRPLVSAEDDPLFSADRVHCPAGMRRRATITVGEVEEIQRRAALAKAGVTA
ncbi:hypothetical protein [Streptomyces sp. TRM68367]|uniref:hypothetical protein n=1 Tax=Streptomyces sp. TRM68367 TaxID=2758415 RepID=UPI00165C03E3|nr:hypothetical protein [Streptomyces sp. TRM68367]MBC9730147.1 hypothetical protein [Streptomyces sp. TRM68367]